MFEISSLKIRVNMRVYTALQLCVCWGIPVEGVRSGWPLLDVSQPSDFAIETFLAQGASVGSVLGSIYSY